MAKAWIDKQYEQKLIDDIDKTFRDGGVVLPSEFRLVYDKPSGQRAKISIYEQHEANKNFKIKVCSLTPQTCPHKDELKQLKYEEIFPLGYTMASTITLIPIAV